MRCRLLVFFACSALVANAQESVPELGRSSDAGQDVYEQRIAGSAGQASAKRIFTEEEVDVLPAFPGGTDSLVVSLWQGCDARMGQAAGTCSLPSDLTFRFVVEADGRTTYGELIGTDACPGLVEAMYCSMRGLPRSWPARVEGRPVRVRLEINIGNGHPSR